MNWAITTLFNEFVLLKLAKISLLAMIIELCKRTSHPMG
ncbi:hypothetical protein PALB_10680 [Pseudoalteromonas luteoviolacea B = ATCC 29581]|nr:hypothetical protein PALB_10680 [Pseudoalteromonas luteoviolacea B = ATCC 29581]